MSLINPDLAIENFTRSSSETTYTLAPGQFGYGINTYGRSFYVKEATGPVLIKTDKTVDKTYKKGQGEDFPEELRYKRLEVSNPSAVSPVTLTIWSGFGKFIDSRFEVLESFTSIVGSATVSIANNTQVNFSGIPAAGQIQRKAFVVSNLDPNNSVFIVDSLGNKCCNVKAGDSITLPVAGAMSVRNESGAAITVYMSEIWYANSP